MKSLLVAAAVLATSLVSFEAGAATSGPSYASKGQGGATASLAWRCGKNNPAMWGTFGNGCLKQKRAWNKGKN